MKSKRNQKLKLSQKLVQANKGISTRHNPAVIYGIQTAGITLIALVVTIVVLLILASVSITVIVKKDGIVNKAQEAADRTEQSVQKEQRRSRRIRRHA